VSRLGKMIDCKAFLHCFSFQNLTE